jgi:hypothetical protein
MESARLYDMTIWAGPKYDENGRRGVLTIEAYFKVALWGTIHQNRNEYLPGIGIPFFRDWVAEHFEMYLRDDEINVRFQRERPAETEDEEITVDFRVFTFRGDRRSAEPYPQETIPLESGGSEYDPDYDEESLDDEEREEDDSDEEEEW